MAEEDIGELGKYRLFPAVAKKYHPNREVFAFHDGDTIVIRTGEPYWGTDNRLLPHR